MFAKSSEVGIFSKTTGIAHNYCSICRVFKKKISTCAFSKRFQLSKRFIPPHGAFILFHDALFFPA
jgi:hypothetical protein